MRVLDLFSGTHSVGKICKELGYEVVSLDIDGRADITVNILDWDYSTYPAGFFDIVWASPPCTEFSIMNQCNKRFKTPDIPYASSLVERALEIIRYFKPGCFFIENPQSGTLKDQPFMAEIPFYDVDYCRYGHPIRKRTRIWTGARDFVPLKCSRGSPCESLVNGKHLNFSYMNVPGQNRLDLRHSIPPALLRALLVAAIDQPQEIKPPARPPLTPGFQRCRKFQESARLPLPQLA